MVDYIVPNWSPEVYWYLLGAVFFLFGALIVLINSISRKNKTVLYFSLCMISFSIFYILTSLSFLLLDINIYRTTYYMVALTTFIFLMFIDSTSRERMNPLNLGFICVLICSILILSTNPEYIDYYDGFGYPSIKGTGMLQFLGSFSLLVFAISSVFWSLRILINAPKHLRKSAVLLLVSTTMFPFSISIWPLQFTYNVPIAIIISGIGIVSMSFILLKVPKLLYILPFKAYRLTVFNRKSGILLFGYQWTNDELNNDIVSGLFWAIERCSIEVLKKGGLKYLALDEGFLIFKKSDNIIVGLISSKISKFLGECVEKFTNEFEEEFETDIRNRSNDNYLFSNATKLLEKYFASVPKRAISSES